MASVALGEAWPLHQLIKLQRSQPALVERAIRRLIDQDEALRWSLVVSAYLDEEVSLAYTRHLCWDCIPWNCESGSSRREFRCI